MADRLAVILGRRLPPGWHQEKLGWWRRRIIARHLDR